MDDMDHIFKDLENIAQEVNAEMARHEDRQALMDEMLPALFEELDAQTFCEVVRRLKVLYPTITLKL